MDTSSIGRIEEAEAPPRLVVLACQNLRLGSGVESCARSGAAETLAHLRQMLEDNGLIPLVDLQEGPCLGYCRRGPNIRIAGHDMIHHATPERCEAVLDSIRAALVAGGQTLPEKPEKSASGFDLALPGL